MKQTLKSTLDIKINHRNWNEALKEAFAYLSFALPSEVVCIVGPSRVGKTRLLTELIRLLVGKQSIEETGVSHSITVTATNSGPNGSFSTKSFILRLLDALKHPMYSLSEDNPDIEKSLLRLERCPEHRLRQAAEHGLVNRQVKYLFIDEAQHILYSQKRSNKAEAILDSWKCLAQDANLVLVLVGAYPLLGAIQNSPHLLGRKHQVHIPRYQSFGEDAIQFAAILDKYGSMLAKNCPKGLLTDSFDMLYEGSLGCIGLLKLWLSRSIATSVYLEKPLSKEILKQTMLSQKDLNVIEKEITEGEQRLRIRSESDSEMLGIAKTNTNNRPFETKPKRRAKNNRKGKYDK